MIAIDPAAVQRIASSLGLTVDEKNAKFLLHTSKCDVHACPGSGKTTLLVAKLALLAREWQWRDCGVLVLSHTNVARHEIETRLAHDPVGPRLLAYPHFVGTVQAFVNRFLALPYMRDVGLTGSSYTQPQIDDDVFADRAWRRFDARRWKEYQQASGYLRRQHDGGWGTVTTLSYTGEDLALATSGTMPGPTTPTAQQLRALKDSLSRQGFFRFRDMFAFARASLKQRPILRDALRRRFPWVFIDEVQDTEEDHEQLLHALFGDACIVQRLGDRNQAIFRDGVSSGIAFSSVDTLDFPRSHRLAPSIARYASRLTVAHRQDLVGNPARTDRSHTIFVFEDGQTSLVLPAFARLLLREWPVLPVPFQAKAVGFRRKVSDRAPGHSCIGSYWDPFPQTLAREHQQWDTLIEFVRNGRRQLAKQRHTHTAFNTVCDGLLALMNKTKVSVTRQQLAAKLAPVTAEGTALRQAIQALLLAPTLDGSTWSAATGKLCKHLVERNVSTDQRSFIEWAPDEHLEPTETLDVNTFRYTQDGRTVDVVLGTIHAVKGETHDATLVLETFDREHDVASIIPLLCTDENPTSKLGKLQQTSMKRIFVAMTRPRELLCFATHARYVPTETAAALRANGWLVTVVAD